MAGGHKINPLILRTPATATSNRPGADMWRRTDGGSRRRRRAHVALLLESRRPPHISLDSGAVLPGMGQLSPCPLSCLPPSQLPFPLPRRCQTTLDMREALASPAGPAPPLTPASQALSALTPGSPRSGTGSASSSGQEALLMPSLPTFPLTLPPFLPTAVLLSFF